LFTTLPSEKTSKPKTTYNLRGINQPVTKKETKIETSEMVEIANQPVSQTSLEQAWKEFAETRKDQPAEYTLLQRPYDFSGSTIHLRLGNPIEEPLLAALQSELLTFLRARLQNHSLLITKQLNDREEVRMIYTNKEKFEHLASQNPIINELRIRWGLDPEF
jgi:hypothetical protein